MRRESDTLRPGAKAPEFTLADPHGASYSLGDLLSDAGTKVPAYEKEVPAYEKEGPAYEKEVPAYDRHVLLLVFDRGTW